MSKVLRKVAMQLQSSTSYDDTGMCLMPFTDNIFNQNFDPIEDDGILGVGFNNTPQQGPRHVGGTYPFNFDAVSSVPLLSAALGGVTGTAFYFNGSHSRKLSICELNSVNAIQYTSCYPRNIKISGSKGALVKLEADIFSVHPQSRQLTSVFPSSGLVSPADPFNFHEFGGTNGYVRLGDQVDGLSSTDDIKIESFNIEIVTGFEEMYANENDLATPQALGPLTPLWGMVRPSVKLSFKIPKYAAETLQTAQENWTSYQMELYAYKSGTRTVKIQFPNIKLKVDLAGDDMTGMNVEALVGRNGVGTSYTNSNMAFNSPIYITIVNA